jgi:hypothetical protein
MQGGELFRALGELLTIPGSLRRERYRSDSLSGLRIVGNTKKTTWLVRGQSF